MAGRTRLYRLLRDDENPMEDGIIAKRPLADETPLKHIRNGSQRNSQWISTSRYLSDVDNFIKLKRKKEGMLTRCRVVEIDEQKLQIHAETCRNEMQQIQNNVMKMLGYIPQNIDALLHKFTEQTIGEILDFTDQSVMDTHIPFNPLRPHENERARGYARKYSEVLVERFIPADCCIYIYNR
ncbi:uncharacterized protein LOC123523800 [Mercenaria mercenaria]|uniref:uncharacterized protein LOC123523800 n=1 Tax=Mercenaria mercenaria TaxID=6596 RepID=UPI00234F3514|nr:uncharacterized protein LOC123523800 [Mercenaria mercenaria]